MEVAELLALKYPFGREHEASIQLLFRSFCNNLFIGQFEWARASIKELHEQRSFLRHHVKNVLCKALERWCESDNPLHPLTWPCFAEYKQLEENASQVEEISKAIEFRFILANVCAECEADILQEIYVFQREGISQLSTQCQTYLTSLLIRVPSQAILLLDSLPLDGITFLMNNIMLDAIDTCVTEQKKSSLYELLARGKLDLAVDGARDRLDVILRIAFTAFQQSAGADESCWLTYSDVMSALASRADTDLYTLAQSVYLDTQDSHTRQCNRWRGHALHTVNSQTHFFNSLLAQGHKFMKEHNYTKLVVLFDTTVWRPLLPVVFHRAWRLCTNTEQSHQVITAFLKVKDKRLTALINQHQRIDVIEQSLNLSSARSRNPSYGTSRVLSVPKSHSVLHALYLCLEDLQSWTHQKMMKTLTAESAYALLDQDISDSTSLSIKQQRDINLFNAFYIIDNFMQALCKACEEVNTVPLSQRYREDVLPHLSTIKKLLADLRPLTLKLEVLEDLFLLLFALGSDVKASTMHSKHDTVPSVSHSSAPPTASADVSDDDTEQYFSAREWMSPVKPSKYILIHNKNGSFKPARIDLASRTERSSDENVASKTGQGAAVGFLANEFITRDILSIVKTALTDITAASFETTNNIELKRVEQELMQVTLSSVTEKTFMSRLSQLQQRVSEAGWRYQLIVQDTVSKEFGTVVLRPAAHNGVHNDDGYGAYERSLHNSGTGKLSPGVHRSEEVNQESELSSEFLTYSSGTNNQTTLSRNKRYKKRISSQNQMVTPPAIDGLIPKMLASPISLLNMCINRQNPTQAAQVIKLYNNEESVEGRQFSFSQSYQQYLIEQTNQESAHCPPASQSSSLTSGVDLSFVRRTATSSLSTMEDSTKAESLALSAVLPAVCGKDVQVGKFLGPNATSSGIATAMVLIDLACASTGSPQRAQDLLSCAQKYINFTSSKSTSGVQNWLKKCLAVNELALSSDQTKVRRLLIDKDGCLSIRNCLLSAAFSMDAAELKDKVVPLLELCNEAETTERAVATQKKAGKKQLLVPSFVVKPLLQALSRHFPSKDRSYLSILDEQIHLLQKTITDNQLRSSGLAAVLVDGPTMTMGRLMFESNVEPSRLAAVAEEMKLDLTHVIVRSCCPPVRCKPLLEDEQSVRGIQQELSTDKRFGYRKVLNEETCEGESTQFDLSPLNTVCTALTAILQLLGDVLADSKTLDRATAIEVKARSEYLSFCEECQHLRRVDLGLLSNDRKKRAFFINLHNLLSLHGLVEMFVCQRSAQKVTNSVSAVTSFQLRHSYLVGQLGLCSIFELQQLFLHVNVVKHLDISVDHPWASYAPEINPLTVFALYDGRANVLPVRCMTADSVDDEISDSVTMYMRRAVLISPQSLQICIPEMLIEVEKELVIEVQRTVPKYEHSSVLLWILEYQPSTRWSEMKLIMERMEHRRESSPSPSKADDGSLASSPSLQLEPSVSIIPREHRLGFSLDAKSMLLSPPAEETDMMTAGPGYILTRSDSILCQAKFKISDVAVQYLRDQSPVVAMLLDIIYEDMQIGREDGKHFNSEALRREYPYLQRYLMQYIPPLCAYISEEIKDLEQLAQIELTSLIKSSILTHKSCLYIENAASRCLDALMLEDKYSEVIEVVNRLIALTGDSCSDWLAIRDLALMLCASEQVSAEALNCIKCLHCERLQCHITISSLHKSRLTPERCIQILPLCEKRLLDKGDNSLVPYLSELITRMSAYHRIMLHAQAKREMCIEGCPSKIIQLLASDWQSVAPMLAEHPREVAHLLFDAHEFKFAKKLIDIPQDVDMELKMLVYKRYIVNCLDSGSAAADEMTAVLSSYLTEDLHWCFRLCMQVLQVLQKPCSMLTVVQFMICSMADSLGAKQRENVQMCHIGVKMLLELDERCHHQYRELIFHPLLIFEQLLMNARTSWAETVIPLLLNASAERDFTEEVNELLVTYAEKAVNFAVVQVAAESSGASNAGMSPTTSTRGRKQFEAVNSASRASPVQKTLLGSSLRRSSTQHSLTSGLSRITTAPGKLSTMTTEQRTSISPSPTPPLTPEKTRGRSGMPEKAPTREEWIPDDQASKCMLCKVETFSMFTRRHHCRRCGLVVCATCSSRTAPVGGRSVRVCEDCYDSMFRQRQRSASPSAHSKKFKDRTSASVSTPVGSPVSALQAAISSAYSEAPEWLLSTSDTDNDEIRKEFFYDHAPSVSLCTAILKLYTDGIECGRHMLRLCEQLSLIIKPIQQTSINQEVDYNLVISMMKFLLLNAKLLFVKEHYIDGVGMCEAYSNRVEVLSLLISDYYINLPTIEELAKIDNVRRLRDRLMEDERPELAMEISTRFGLETTAIWTAWGMSCLRRAEYMAARHKFCKFLKPLKEKNVQIVAHSTILNDIINTLMGQASYNSVCYTQTAIESILRTLTSGQDISKSIPMLPTNSSKLDGMDNLTECQFYLDTFANHQMIIKFYTSHGYVPKALQHCLDCKCSTEVFIEHIFLPFVARGELAFFQEQLLSVDPLQLACIPYLTAVCRYLARQGQYHVLYHMQLFTKDHLRAAMTCIQAFYLTKVKSYTDLNSRNHHLTKALEHYQSYLNPPKLDRTSRLKPAQHSPGSELAARLTQPESEVRRMIGLVKLQMDVAKHMSSSGTATTPVLSLFGEQQERTTLASQVILVGRNVSSGFQLAFRIIQDCQLSYSKVYTLAAQQLSTHKAYSSVKLLVSCIKESGLCDTALLDRVLLTAVETAGAGDSSKSGEIENLIKLLNTTNSKIDAYILCGKLRSAYLLAIQSDSVETVRRIAQEAVRVNQTAVKNICDKYIKQKEQQQQ